MNRERKTSHRSFLRTALISDIPTIATSLLIVVISLTVCWLGDDIDYMFRIKTAIWDSWGFIGSPADLVRSQWNHYLFVNGRVVAHILVQLFCGVFGQTAFALCNGAVWYVFLHLIATGVHPGSFTSHPRLFARDRAKESFSSSLTVATLALLSFITKMMPTTQIGYIWMFTIILLWLSLYYSDRCSTPAGIILLTLFGIIAGNAQEALSIGVCVMLAVTIFSRWREIFSNRKSALRALIPAIGFFAGVATDCFSPSTLHRAVSYADTVSVCDSLLFAVVALRGFWLMLVISAFMIATRKLSFRHFVKDNLPCVLAIACLFLFNLAIGIKSNRQLFGIELLSILLMLRILPARRLSAPVLIPVTAAVVMIYGFQIQSALRIRYEFKEIVEEYKESSNGVILHSRLRGSTNPLTREFRLYEEIAGQFDNDVRHSIMKLLCHKIDGKKVIKFVPEYVAKDSARRVADPRHLRDTIVKLAEGHYSVISRSDEPRIAVITRNQITGTEHPDTLFPGRPTSSLTVAGTGEKWNFFEILPDRPFEIVVGIDKIFVNSQSEHPVTEIKSK